jgi:transposase
VLVTGIAWRHLPPGLGCSPATAHRRLQEWEREGVWRRLHGEILTQLLALVDAVGPVRGRIGRPRQRSERLLADRGYDHDKYRRELWARGVKPVIARRETEHGSSLGTERWVVERTFAWLHNFRRLRTRYERRAELHLAFMHLGCAAICQRMLAWP